MNSSASQASQVCGDDIQGRRVACRCGDIVVSDTKLLPGDPVLAAPCGIDGLIVRADGLAEGIVLDLNGQTLRGHGTGVGIRVDSGGADGAAIVGGPASTRGEIVGFGTGILARYAGVLRRIERVGARSSRHDGIALRTRGTILIDIEASDNGSDGVRLTGEGGRLIDVVTERNGDAGLRVLSSGTSISARTQDNKNHGLVADGRRIEIRQVVARGNGGRGVMLHGGQSKVVSLVSEANVLADLVPAPGGGS